jgi:hypothetical protein
MKLDQEVHMIEVSGTAPPSQEPADPVGFDRGARIFVWAVWALVVLTATTFVIRYGRNFPKDDDFALTEMLAGKQPLTLSWLWAQHNEHRIAVPKLLHVALLRLTNGDFRAGTYFNLFVLSAAAAGFILTARKLRGWTSAADAFFPLGLLTWGNGGLLWNFHVVFTSSTVLACFFLLVILRSGERLSLGGALAGGVCVLLLPLCGGNGLGLAPCFALWLVAAGVLGWKAPHGKRVALVSLVLATAAAVLTVYYFIDYHKPSYSPPSPSWKNAIKGSLVILSAPFGPTINRDFWPASALVMPALLLAAFTALALAWRAPRQQTVRKLGLCLFLGAMTTLCLMISWARAGFGVAPGECWEGHYHLIPLPLLMGIYFVAGLYGGAGGKHVLQIALLVLVSMSFALHTSNLSWWRSLREQNRLIEQDLRAGMTPEALAQRRLSFFCVVTPGFQDYVAHGLRVLRDGGVGDYRLLRPDVPCQEVPLPVQPTTICPSGTSVVWRLDQPRYVHAIRLKGTYVNAPSNSAKLQMFWKENGRNEFTEAERYVYYQMSTTPVEQTLTVQIQDSLDQFRLDPDIHPCGFQVSEIVLLEPLPDSQASR